MNFKYLEPRELVVSGLLENGSEDFGQFFYFFVNQCKNLESKKRNILICHFNELDYKYLLDYYIQFFNSLDTKDFEKNTSLASHMLDVGRSMLWIFFPRNISREDYEKKIRNDGIPNPVITELLESFNRYSEKEIEKYEINIKIMFRDILEGVNKYLLDDESLDNLKSNQSIYPFLYQYCDICGVNISEKVNTDSVRKCDTCKEKCSTISYHSKDPISNLQALTKEIESYKISIDERAVQIAKLFMEEGIFNLTDLKYMNDEELALIIQKLKLNTLQVQKLKNSILSL